MIFGPSNWSGHFGNEKSLLCLLRFKVLPVAGHYIDCAVPAVVLSDGAVSGTVLGLVLRIHCMIYF